MSEVLRFYWLAIREMPNRIMEAAHLAHTLVFLAGMTLLIFGLGTHELNPWWGLSLLIAAFVNFFAIGVYKIHRDLLRRRGERCFWAYKGPGGFYREDGRDWREIGAEGKLIGIFREMACTNAFTELHDSSRDLRIRLRADRVELRQGKKGRFAHYRDGGWVKPANPILAKHDLRVQLDLASGTCVKTAAAGRHVLYARVKNTGDRNIVIENFGIGIEGSKLIFSLICHHDEKLPDELRPGHSWNFYADPEALVHALHDSGQRGAIRIQGVCVDTLGRIYRSNSITLDTDLFGTNDKYSCKPPEGSH